MRYAVIIPALLLAGCAKPPTNVSVTDLTGENRPVAKRNMDGMACLKDLTDHRSARTDDEIMTYMQICMASKGWALRYGE